MDFNTTGRVTWLIVAIIALALIVILFVIKPEWAQAVRDFVFRNGKKATEAARDRAQKAKAFTSETIDMAKEKIDEIKAKA